MVDWDKIEGKAQNYGGLFFAENESLKAGIS